MCDNKINLLRLVSSSTQPLEKEIVGYKPEIDDVNKVGQSYDEVIHEVEQPLSLGPHLRSLQAGSGQTSPRKTRHSMSLLDRSSMYGMDGKLPWIL